MQNQRNKNDPESRTPEEISDLLMKYKKMLADEGIVFGSMMSDQSNQCAAAQEE